MALAVSYELQGSTDTTIDSGDRLQFASGSFNGEVTVASYQDSMHVDQNSAGSTDDAASNTPNNVKFVSQSGGTGSDSQADWGDGTEDLDAILDSECTLKITVTNDSAIALSNVKFYAYDGSTTTATPTGVTFIAAETGDTNWTSAEGSGSALSLDDSSSATSHDFYVNVSATPDSTGAKTAFQLRFEFNYQ